MAEDQVHPEELQSLQAYLAASDEWQRVSSGVAGSLWESSTQSVALPFTVDSLSRSMWLSLLGRVVSDRSRVTASDFAQQLSFGIADVSWLRVSSDSEHSVPLEAGVALLGAGHKLLRAAATTAQRARPDINGNFSAVGDHIVGLARMGHTKPGSFKVPIMLPLPPVETSEEEHSHEALIEISRVSKEPAERRVMRTLAESMVAISAQLVGPGKEPTRRLVNELVPAGVSREQLMTLRGLLLQRDVDALSATFEWAPGYRRPAVDRADTEVPAEAAPLLRMAAAFMRQTRRETQSTLTGPIIEIRHQPDAPRGSVTLQTIRRGREVEVRVTVTAETVDLAFEWMRGGETVVVEGSITSAPGRPLEIGRPETVFPLSTTFLPGD